MATKWGRVPTDAELIAILQALSNKLYKGEWMPGNSTFNVYRDPVISTSRRILRDRDLPATATAWADLVASLTGLHVRPVADARRQAANHRWSRISAEDTPILNAPINHLGPSAWQLAAAATEGLSVLERWITLRSWDCASQQWVDSGKQLVYEVR